MVSYTNSNYTNELFDLNGIYFNPTNNDLDKRYLLKSGGNINNLVVENILDIKTLTLPNIGNVEDSITTLSTQQELNTSAISTKQDNITSSTDINCNTLTTVGNATFGGNISTSDTVGSVSSISGLRIQRNTGASNVYDVIGPNDVVFLSYHNLLNTIMLNANTRVDLRCANVTRLNVTSTGVKINGGTSQATQALDVAGNITTTGTVISNGTTLTSDDRIKHNETDIKNGLEIIRQLKPQVYQKTQTMKEADYNGVVDETYTIEAGFIAQEVLKIDDISYCVSGGDYYDIDNNLITSPYGINYNNIFTYAVSALQEVDTELQSEKLKMEELQTKYEDLLNRVIKLESK